MMLLLKKETLTSYKLVYLDAMEDRVHLHPDPISQFWEVIVQYESWHRHVTENLQVEVVELDFLQNQA